MNPRYLKYLFAALLGGAVAAFVGGVLTSSCGPGCTTSGYDMFGVAYGVGGGQHLS